jgi:hypothetical protein
MGIFDSLFQAKPKVPDGSKHTLIIFDWDSFSHEQDFHFITQYENPVLWFVTRGNRDPRWDVLKSKYPVTYLQVPDYERSLISFLICSLIFEVASNKIYKKVVIAAGHSYFKGTVSFLLEKKILAELYEVDGRFPSQNRRDIRDNRDNRRPQDRQRDSSANDRQREPNDRRRNHPEQHEPRIERQIQSKNTTRPINEPTRRSGVTSAPIVPEKVKDVPTNINEPTHQPEQANRLPTPEDLQKIIDFFNKNYTPENIYPKSYFGLLVKQATKRNAPEVLGTKNAKPFIQVLVRNGCIEQVDEQSFRVLKPAQVSMFTSSNGRSNSKRKPYHRQSNRRNHPSNPSE